MLVGKRVVVGSNLTTAKVMGVESQGMLVTASKEGDTALEILTPEKQIPAGPIVHSPTLSHGADRHPHPPRLSRVRY